MFAWCMFVMLIVAGVTFHRLRRKYNRQDSKYIRLNRRHDQFQAVKNDGQQRCDQEGHDREQNTTRKDITKETEGKRDDLTEFRDDFDEADDEVNRAEGF